MTVPADASSLIPPALDQLCEHPEVAPQEVAGLLERLAQVPDPRDPRGVRHPLSVVLALAACAVLAGATSLLAVGEWITHAPPQVLERVGVRPDPLFPKRSVSAETTVRRLLARRQTQSEIRTVQLLRGVAQYPPGNHRRQQPVGGCAAVEQAARDAGYDVTVPFAPGRTDASQEQTDAASFAVLEPKADAFRNYLPAGVKLSPETLMLDHANLLTLTAPEMAVLIGGMRALNTGFKGSPPTMSSPTGRES